MAKTVSYINTSPRGTTTKETVSASPSRSYSPGGSGGVTVSEILNRIMPVIAENYADAVTQLTEGCYLHNPGFADGLDGWAVSDPLSVYIIHPDNKNRLFLSEGGSVTQENSLIRKPGKHKEYTYTEETEEEEEEGDGSGTAEETFTPSEELATDQVTWADIEEPQRTEGSEEKPDTLYLTMSFICKESGTINVGFVGADESSEDALKLQSVETEASEEIQVIEAEGTWDGTGDFSISLSSGRFEIVSLSLLDKPLEEYRKQTDSHLKQVMENIVKAYEFIHAAIKRIILIQGHVNQLYSNDALFKETTEDLENRMEAAEKTLEEHTKDIASLYQADVTLYELIDGISTTLTDHETRITAAQKKADSAYDKASDAYYNSLINSIDISALESKYTSLSNDISNLSSAVSSLETSLSSLEERVAALEKAE